MKPSGVEGCFPACEALYNKRERLGPKYKAVI